VEQLQLSKVVFRRPPLGGWFCSRHAAEGGGNSKREEINMKGNKSYIRGRAPLSYDKRRVSCNVPRAAAARTGATIQ